MIKEGHEFAQISHEAIGRCGLEFGDELVAGAGGDGENARRFPGFDVVAHIADERGLVSEELLPGHESNT